MKRKYLSLAIGSVLVTALAAPVAWAQDAAPSDAATQEARATRFSRKLGANTSTNPCPLMSCEKLDTQNGIRNSRSTVQRSGGGLPASRTDR